MLANDTKDAHNFSIVKIPVLTNTMIDELRDMLNYAEKKNVLVTACLWNGASQRSQAYVERYFWDSLFCFV